MKKIKLLTALCFVGSIANAQIISTVAGTGYGAGPFGGGGFSGDGGQATSARLSDLNDVAFDASGNMYIADYANARVRKVNTSGVITTVAGNGTTGYSGDGGQATAAELYLPAAVAVDGSGNLFIAEANLGGCCFNNRIRKVNTSGIITTIAGNGTGGYSGDGGQATAAEINNPFDLAFDASGNLYFVDGYNNRVRKINTSGIITTIAGNGTSGFSGDGGQATNAELSRPEALAVDYSGNLYISDQANQRIRKVSTSGIITTVVGNGTAGFSGDGGQATAAEIYNVDGIATDKFGSLYIADGNNARIRKVNASGVISTIAGNGTSGYSGDGGQATAAEMYYPASISFDATGNLYIADTEGQRVRKITPCPANAGPNVTDYDSDGSICAAVQLGTASISGLTYAWSPTVALSCTNCAQPNTTYDNISTPQVYTLTVSGSGCTTSTSTVQVTTSTQTISPHITSTHAINGSNITATGIYSANFTPTSYSWTITQCTSTGGSYPGGYTANSGLLSGAPSGTYTFANTSTLTCNTYYLISFWVGNSCASNSVTSPVIYTTLDPYFTLNSTKINSTTYTATAGYPLDNPTGSPGYGYYWDVVETDAGGTPISGTEVTNPSCWWTYSTPNTFNGYNSTSTLGSCSSVGQFIAGDYYRVTYGVWSTACAWTQSTLQMALCGGTCRTAGNPDGVLISPVLDAPDQSGYLQTLQTGIANNTAADALHVYPNPNNGTFFIEGNTDAGQLLQVFDVNGRLVLSQKIQGRTIINASSLPDGVYNINISGNNTITNKKLVIVK